MHRPTTESKQLVASMASLGIPQEDIAKVVGVTAKTLRKHYGEELEVSAAKANAAVGGALYSAAMSGDVRAQIFWCKTRLGWREVNRHELTGSPDGENPIKQAITVTFVDADKDKDD